MAKHSPLRRRLNRLVLYRLEAALLWLFVRAMRAVSIERASAFGGWLGRTVGPRLKGAARSRRNIARAFPELEAAAVERILVEAWDNFGRTFAEFPHLHTIARDWDSRVEKVDLHHLVALAGDGRPGIAFTGHFGNWELAALACNRCGLDLLFVYRAPNNPFADRELMRARTALGGRMAPKGKQAAKEMLATLRRGSHLGLLVDQKLNEGIPVPFLGRDAMTGTFPAELALRYDAPLVPILVTRLPRARFRVQAFPPMPVRRSGDDRVDVATLMRDVNDLLSGWVRDDPGQWHWQHSRWPD